jgi:superfamily II DNA or RNA helicase
MRDAHHRSPVDSNEMKSKRLPKKPHKLTERDRRLSRALGTHTDFASLHAAWATIPASLEKGGPFEDFVKHFLRLDPRYASRLKHVWLSNEVPAPVAAKLRLPPCDKGIDLVAETNDGAYWAIQTKFRSDTSASLTWKGDLSTFVGLAFVKCRNISFGLVCATSERLPHLLRAEPRLGLLARDTWFGLGEEFFSRLRRRLQREEAPLTPLSPRPHQQAALTDITTYFGSGVRRGKLIMPCGTGKSLTAYWASKDLRAKRILVAVPSLALLNQTLNVWLRESMANCDNAQWLCVCSDETTGKVVDEDVSFLRQDLAVECLTDPAEIGSRLDQHRSGRLVVFTTYQSGARLAAAARKKGFSFDLGIFDEAHRTTGKKAGVFAHLLSDGNIRIRRRLFMTATERRYRGHSDDVVTMKDPKVFGDTAHILSFKKALESEPSILCNYKIVTLYMAQQEVADLVRRNAFVRARPKELSHDIEAVTLASLIALRKAFRDHPITHAVSFHRRKSRAREFAKLNDAFSRAMPGYPSLQTFHVTGDMPTAMRAKEVEQFTESSRALITNARCLTEGVDVPKIDAVLFADARRSSIDIVQAVGRALRPSAGKKLAYVVVPVLFDHTRPIEEQYDEPTFKQVLATLRALAANDERIVEEFRAVSEGRVSAGSVVDVRTTETLAKLIDVDTFAKAIQLQYWDRTAALAWRPFLVARESVRALGMKSQLEWFQYAKGVHTALGKRPADIPSLPPKAYSTEWVNWGDWLGTGTTASQLVRYRPFRKARAFARKLGLASSTEWERYVAGKFPDKDPLPFDIPSNPGNTYRTKGWAGWGDWLGTGRIANQCRQWRPFRQARRFARSLGLSSQQEWFQYARSGRRGCPKRPTDIPTSPNAAYAGKGWVSYGDWLGTGTVANQARQFWPFRRARAFVRRLKLKSGQEWTEYAAGRMKNKGVRPRQIPSNPNAVYSSEGWIDIADWLGKKPYRERK